jgi:uncharacterized membrane protein YbhN (UPF0104 family)
MPARFRQWAWPISKVLLALAILTAVGWQFWRDLHHESLHDLRIHWPWLVLSALIYLIGMGFSCWYWYRLLVVLGEQPLLLKTCRAYYISQLAKYLPGKAWALLVRGTLVRSSGVKLSVALVATFYEVLTSMTSGALLAALLFTIWQPRSSGDVFNPALLGVFLFFLCGVPLLPGVFNRVIGLLAGRFPKVQGFQMSRLGAGTLIEGLATTSGVWLCFGFSLWAMVQGVSEGAAPLTVEVWAHLTASMALACVSGFVAVVVPGGVGVREWVLNRLLATELTAIGVSSAEPKTVIIVLLLRLCWTAGEVVVAGSLWPARWLYAPRT